MNSKKNPVGRPRRTQEVRVVSVQLPMDQVRWLEQQGGGNVSLALRVIVSQSIAAKESK